MKKGSVSFKQAILFTIISCNLMLIALLVAQHQYNLQEIAEPAVSHTPSTRPHSRYSLEFISSSKKGPWLVEHYREYEYRFDEQGHVIDRRPTGKEENLRYYQPQ